MCSPPRARCSSPPPRPTCCEATLASRSQLGRCWLLDPTGTLEPPPGAHLVRWSPVQASTSWEEALVTARVMTTAARPHGSYGESAHWTERGEALLAPMLHAAAISGQGMREVLAWTLRHDLHTPMALLVNGGHEAAVAMDVLAGIAATEEREKSGIFSTTAGALAAYRSGRALALTDEADFNPAGFAFGGDTIYICAPARYQALAAPIVVAFLEQLRAATYRASADGTLRLPVTLVLDEVANIAPLPDLPAMVSEGGGQGLLTLACLQDLSQARGRWGSPPTVSFPCSGPRCSYPGSATCALWTPFPVGRARRCGRPVGQHLRLVVRAPLGQHDLLDPTPGLAPRRPGAQPGPGDGPRDRRCPPAPARRPAPRGGGARPFPRPEGPGHRPSCRSPQALRHPGPPRAPLSPPLSPLLPPGAPNRSGDLPVTWRRVPGQRRPRPPSSRL